MTDAEKYGRERYRRIDLPKNSSAEVWLERRGQRVELHHSYKSPNSSGGGGGGGWDCCSHHGCLGEAITVGGACIAHTDSATRQAYLKNIGANKRGLSLQGIQLSQPLWDEIIASPIFDSGIPCGPISFVGTEINAEIRLDHREFRHALIFKSAVIFSRIHLRQCLFHSSVSATYCLISRGASLDFHASTFKEKVIVSHSKLEDSNFQFSNCTFQRSLEANGTDGTLVLQEATFQDRASFQYSKAWLILSGAKALGPLEFANSEYSSLHGDGLDAEAPGEIGPFKVPFLTFKQAKFSTRVRFDVVAERVDLSGANFNGGGSIEFSRAKIDLSQISVGGSLRISGNFSDSALPEIVNLLNADAGQITLARVDLTRCSFYGVHKLDGITFEETVFARSPWWAGRRRYISDEYSLRKRAGWPHSLGWKMPEVRIGSEPLKPSDDDNLRVHLPSLDASQIAPIYRALRRSMESKSDMPTASDFYYGEMEMRRWNKKSGILERLLLSAYWALSGYGLRAWRALAWWVILVASGTYLMSWGGFEEGDYSPFRGLLFSVRASLPGVSTIEKLAVVGQAIEVGLRILGPIMLAFFFIAVRAKLMRKPSD